MSVRDFQPELRIFSNSMAIFYREGHPVYSRMGKDGKAWEAEPMQWREVERDELSMMGPQPLMMLSDDACQRLMEDLWSCGFRPSAAKGSAGQMAAVQEHLADMRRLVAKTVKVELP